MSIGAIRSFDGSKRARRRREREERELDRASRIRQIARNIASVEHLDEVLSTTAMSPEMKAAVRAAIVPLITERVHTRKSNVIALTD